MSAELSIKYRLTGNVACSSTTEGQATIFTKPLYVEKFINFIHTVTSPTLNCGLSTSGGLPKIAY